MITIELMTMEEYVPVNEEVVDLYLLKDYIRAGVVVGIDLVVATCAICYQGYDPENKSPIPLWTSDSSEQMAKIKFDAPFVHLVEPYDPPRDVERVVGFRYIGEQEIACMGTESFNERIGEMTNNKYNASLPTHYYKKEYYFMYGNDHQILYGDPDKEVLGIMHKDKLEASLKERIAKSLRG